MSTSFPYLTLARELGLNYGLVLCYADHLEKSYNSSILELSWFEIEAAYKLTVPQQYQVHRVWLAEHERRQDVGVRR